MAKVLAAALDLVLIHPQGILTPIVCFFALNPWMSSDVVTFSLFGLVSQRQNFKQTAKLSFCKPLTGHKLIVPVLEKKEYTSNWFGLRLDTTYHQFIPQINTGRYLWNYCMIAEKSWSWYTPKFDY